MKISGAESRDSPTSSMTASVSSTVEAVSEHTPKRFDVEPIVGAYARLIRVDP